MGTKPIAGTAGTLSYDALVDFWSQFDPYTMNTLLVGDAMAQILKLEEMQDSTAGLAFQGTGKLVTPMGAHPAPKQRGALRDHHWFGQAVCLRAGPGQ